MSVFQNYALLSYKVSLYYHSYLDLQLVKKLKLVQRCLSYFWVTLLPILCKNQFLLLKTFLRGFTLSESWNLYRKNKATSFRVRLQSTTARYISVGIWYKHKARFAWVSSAWLGFIEVHIKYNGICGARCYLAPYLTPVVHTTPLSSAYCNYFLIWFFEKIIIIMHKDSFWLSKTVFPKVRSVDHFWSTRII